MQPQACRCGLPMLWGGNMGRFMETEQEARSMPASGLERMKEIMERTAAHPSVRKWQDVMEQSGVAAKMRDLLMQQQHVIQTLPLPRVSLRDIVAEMEAEQRERVVRAIDLTRQYQFSRLDLWRRDFGTVPTWLERRQPDILHPPVPEAEGGKEAIDSAAVVVVPAPLGSDAVRLIREDDEEGLKRALARINARKSAQVFDARTVALYEDFITSGLSKTEFAKRNHKKHHIGYATCRKKRKGIEEKVEGIKKK